MASFDAEMTTSAAGTKSKGKEPATEKSMQDEPAPYEAASASREIPTFLKRSVDPAWIDIEMLGHWLQTCDEEHGESCRRPLNVDASNLGRPEILIDVQKMCLTYSEPSYRYACLSYVWGGVSTLQTSKENLVELLGQQALEHNRDKIPKTIRDTIGLVAQLGINHLWVDQLCIIQDDVESKHDQIQAMAGIYANAYVTIIAANGWDAAHGLRGIPGVTESRHISSFSKSDFQENAQPFDSIWYSRGWCFQEMVLSPRKIMFQYQLVLWECNRASWNEASLSTAETSFLPPGAESRISSRASLARITSTPNIPQYVTLVRDYTLRKLTHPSDGVKAITGLLSLISSAFTGRFISGLPEMFFNEALLWQPKEALQRRQPRDMVRAPPSWSWAGWEGAIISDGWLSHFSHLHSHYIKLPDTESEIQIKQVIPLVVWYYGNSLTTKRRILTSSQPLPPISAQYLFCRTKRAVFGSRSGRIVDHQNNNCGGIEYGYTPPLWETLSLVAVSKGRMIIAPKTYWSRGQLFLQVEDIVYLNSWGGFNEYRKMTPQGHDDTYIEKGLPESWKVLEFYYVMAVGWQNGVAYRKGIGRIEQDAWERHATEDIDLVLG